MDKKIWFPAGVGLGYSVLEKGNFWFIFNHCEYILIEKKRLCVSIKNGVYRNFYMGI